MRVNFCSAPWKAVIHTFQQWQIKHDSILKNACYLSEFPGDADGPAEAVAADEQGLHSPACKVAKSKDVEVAQNPLPRYHCAVYSIFLVRRMVTELLDTQWQPKDRIPMIRWYELALVVQLSV